MKLKLLIFAISTALIVAVTTLQSCETEPCTYNGKELHEGSQGGCYYINSNGNKTYVDRSYCDCK